MIRIHYVAFYNAVISSYNEDSTKHTKIEDTSGKTEMSFYIKICFVFLILGSDLHYKAVPEH